MTRIKLGSLLIALFFISLVATMPASLILKEIKFDKNISIGTVSGNWWSFQVDWLSYKGVTVEKIAITLQPSCLFLASVCFNVHNEDINAQLKRSIFTDDFSIENSKVIVAFDQLSPLMKTLFVKPSGSLEIKVSSLQWSKQTITKLDANVNWRSVGIQGESFKLGDIMARVSHQPQTIVIKLSDRSEVLDLSGDVKISKKGFIESTIELKTLKGFPPPIKSVIQGVMKKRGRDIYEYKSKISQNMLKKVKINF